MEGKICTKCGEWKEINNFGFRDKKKGFYKTQCKQCENERHKKWVESHKENVRESKRKWREKNPDYSKQYNLENKEKLAIRSKQYRESNKEHLKEKAKEYYQNNKEHIKERSKQWRDNNEEKSKRNKKLYYEKTKEHKKEYDRQRHANIREVNIRKIENVLEQVNLLFKELNLNIYGYIYKITHINGRCYIGQTTRPLNQRYGSNVIARWIEERKMYENQKFKEELIEENFVLTEVLDVAFCQYHLDKLEAYYIDKYDSFLNGYNNRSGNFKTNDGIEEFENILKKYNLKFVDGELRKNE